MSIGGSKIHLRLEYDGRTLYEIDADDINTNITIGRSSDSMWKLPSEDTRAHRHHAVLRRLRNGNLILEDCNGRESIYYLNKTVKEHRMQIGDLCGIGNAKLIAEKAEQDEKRKGMLLYNQLEQLTGEAKGKIYRIEKENFDIGSAPTCACQINDSLVSQQHAIIEQHPDGTCWIKDNHSLNGTTVNGVPLREENAQIGRMLKDGDIIAVAYVELKFWDKNVVHVRSHLVLKLCAFIATLAVALGGYFGFQTIMPSAKALRLRAEQYAANEQFDMAENELKKAGEARGADTDREQRAYLTEKLESWRNTLDDWYQVQQGLKNGKENNDFILLCGKLAAKDVECWKWDGDVNGVHRMKQAQDTNGMLVYTRSAEEALSKSLSEEKYLLEILGKLELVTRNCSAEPLDFRAKLLVRAEDSLKELRETLDVLGNLKNLLAGYREIGQTDEIIGKIQNLSNKWNEHLADRNNSRRPASKMIQWQCDACLQPMQKLKSSYECLQNNYLALAKFNFPAFRDNLPLPSKELCIVAPTLSSRCDDMRVANDNLVKIRVELENKSNWFEREFPEGKSKMLAEFFSEDTIEAVLTFDCLNRKMPTRSDKDPQSQYDKVLGVYVFYNYLKTLDTYFDDRIFERQSKPMLFQVVKIFDTLESFLNYCRLAVKPSLKPQMETLLAISPQENRVVKLLDLTEGVLKQRDEQLRELYGIFKNEPTTRRGIVAGGMACRLMTKRHTFIEGKLNEEVVKALRKLNVALATVAAKAAGDITPEQLMKVERELLELGIPGDKLISQPWTDKFTKD